MSNISNETPHLTIENLQPGEDYKFRFTPILRGLTNLNDTNASQLSLVLDVKMPSTRKPKSSKSKKKNVSFSTFFVFLLFLVAKIAIPPPQFAIHQVDPTRVFIEAILSKDQLERFDQIYDVYSKTDTENDQWTKVTRKEETERNFEEKKKRFFRFRSERLTKNI